MAAAADRTTRMILRGPDRIALSSGRRIKGLLNSDAFFRPPRRELIEVLAWILFATAGSPV
jgi:hypothetical protein